MTSALSDEVASAWFACFSEHLQRGDVASTTSLFLPNGWLRDFLAFDWDLRTLHGHEKISSYLSEHLPNSNFLGFELASDQYFKPSPGPMPGTVTAGFSFSTPIANGRGYFNLSSTTEIEDIAGWKASTVFITIDSLKNHEEKGAAGDIYGGRCPTWGEARDIEWRKAEEEPEVLISMCSAFLFSGLIPSQFPFSWRRTKWTASGCETSANENLESCRRQERPRRRYLAPSIPNFSASYSQNPSQL